MNNSVITLFVKKFMTYSQRRIIRLLKPLVSINEALAEISQRPPGLVIEVTNICNANCIFCAYPYLKRPKKILPMVLFKKAIDEFSALGGGEIGFTPSVGDPLIDPDFIEKIKYARNKKNISGMGFFTNGILINKVGARSIINSGIDAITISIPGFDAQTYSRIFRVNCWNEVYEGILNLLKENALSNNIVRISIGLRSDLPAWRLFKTPAYQALRRFRFNLEYQFYYDNWSGLINQGNLRGIMRLRKPPRKIEPCSLLYCGPMILSNGDMALCGCRDLNGELIIGNIANKSIWEMWHDPRVQDIRDGFYASRYPKICQNCSFYNDLSCFRKEKIKALLKGRSK